MLCSGALWSFDWLFNALEIALDACKNQSMHAVSSPGRDEWRRLQAGSVDGGGRSLAPEHEPLAVLAMRNPAYLVLSGFDSQVRVARYDVLRQLPPKYGLGDSN